jgi:3-phosphoshikimate 1-carboxyvinyltransferase
MADLVSETETTARWRVSPVVGVEGELTVPGDKSISHRALLLGAIAEGLTEIEGFLESEDCLRTLHALRSMGVRIQQGGEQSVRVRGGGLFSLQAPDAPLDLGNSGTAMRLLIGLLSWQKFASTLIGDASLMNRPMNRVSVPLRMMGARIETREGMPPVIVHGSDRLRGIPYKSPIASAQVKSALLLAGLRASGETTISEPATSRDHTERMLNAFGVPLRREGTTVAIKPVQRLRGTRIDVPADFSSAAFFLVGGSIARSGTLRLRDVGVNPTRTGLLEILTAMGADIAVERRVIHGPEPVADLVVRPASLHGIEVPLELVPRAIDEFPAFFIAAACAEGPSILRGAEELRVKETDRLTVMSSGLTALGVRHRVLPDGMLIEGRKGAGPVFSGGTVDSRGDHRVAMAFAMASLQSSAPIEVLNTTNVATSFPGFAGLARSCGFDLEES